MVLKLPVQAARAVPVTVGEFYAAFVRIWNDAAPRRNKNAAGLAISGGVDSMALASLCAKLQQRDLIRGLSFRAFVVDHGARAGSSEEAEAVSKLLLQKGIDTKILKIKWPRDFVIQQAPNFESLAREYRFKALGRACKDAKLDALFVAHHEDDQAETILMRLALGHKSPSGLIGMKARNSIPECYGIHGVHESGHIEDLNEPGGSVPNFSPQPLRRRVITGQHSRPSMAFEGGGVMVYRPLLNFSKERLLATCLEDNTSWFEDYTNADPGVTFRNAIRHLSKHHRLPAVLQKRSLIEMAGRMAEKQSELNSKVMLTLKRCSVRSFEPRVGRLILRFPRIPSDLPLPITELERERALRHHREVANAVLKVAASAVSPKEHITIHDMTIARKAIFPQLDPDEGSSAQRLKAFTAAGVKFDRLDLQRQNTEAEKMEDAEAEPTDSLLGDHEWSLTPQLYSSLAWQRPLLVIPPAGDSSHREKWSLYDGRYWMRIVNRTGKTLHVRPLQTEDISAFEAKQRTGAYKFRDRVGKVAPGMSRFMLPAIVSVLGPGKEQILAMPTLNLGIPGVGGLVEWEVRYKKVNGLGEWIKKDLIPLN